MNFENINMWWWWMPLLVGAICGIIGYYWGRGSVKTIDNSAELRALRDISNKLQLDLDACNKKLIAALAPKPSGGANVTSSLSTTTAKTASAAKVVAFDVTTAKTVLGKTVNEDDLKVVEGIGPKIEEMFHQAGIKTWKALSETSVAGCQEILNKGGERFRIHDPASWPMQAKMCYENKWKELMRWQDEHNHGKL